MTNDLVSIVMLSRNDGRLVEETVRSVLAQTYQNWEILFVAERHKDEALEKILNLRKEESDRLRKDGREWSEYSSVNDKIKVSYIVGESDEAPRRNTALKDARGRWIAFLDAGDVWEPTKLERQIAFMEEHGHAFSYTKYGLIDSKSNNRGVEIGGKEHVTHEDMMKCCWPAYMTVMYDAAKVGKVQVRNLKENNDYALWLNICEKADCYLLDENLAKMRTPWDMMGRLLLTNKIKWRYEVYRIEEDLGIAKSVWYTIINGFNGIIKWWAYSKKSPHYSRPLPRDSKGLAWSSGGGTFQSLELIVESL